jgi:hypothetical protein
VRGIKGTFTLLNIRWLRKQSLDAYLALSKLVATLEKYRMITS